MSDQIPAQMHATLLDLVKTNDPYAHPSNPLVHPRDKVRMVPLHFTLADHHLDPPVLPIGHIHPTILADMVAFNIDTDGQSFTFHPVRGRRADHFDIGAIRIVAFKDTAAEKGEEELTRMIDCFVAFMRKRGTIPEDRFGAGDDRFAIHASPDSAHFAGEKVEYMGNKVATVARSASGYFGFATYGVKAILCEGVGAEMKIWVQVRSKTLKNWVGDFDVSAGGALTAGLSPLEGIASECSEEAELPVEFCRQVLKYTSSASYWMTAKDWVRPHNILIFGAELKAGMPRPKVPTELVHGIREVDGYLMMTPSELKVALLGERFHPHAAMGMIRFLDAHGFLTDEDGVGEIRWRCKRDQGIAKPVGLEEL